MKSLAESLEVGQIFFNPPSVFSQKTINSQQSLATEPWFLAEMYTEDMT